MEHRRSQDLALLGVSVLAISTAAPLIRAADAPSLAVAFWRVALAVPVTGLLVATRHRGELHAVGNRMRRFSAIAGVFLAAHFATWVPSLSFTSVASSVALVSTQPVWAAVLARLRGEHVPRRVWQGIALALVGVVMLTGVDLTISLRALLGDVLALVGGVMAALYVTVGAQVRQQASTAVYATLCYATGGLVLLAVCGVGQQAVAGYDGATWLALLALMAGPQLLGHTVMNQVLRTAGPTVVSMAILFEIVGSALLAWVFFSEVPPASVLPAGLLIGAGIVMVVRSATSPAPQAVPSA